MTVLQKKAHNPIGHLTPEDIEQIGVELDAIRQSVIDTRGADDAAYIRKVIAAQRKLELGSRAVLLVSMFPPAWVVGTAGLAVAKIIENMEIGHNVMHGQWDWMRDPKIHSTTWEWDNASPVGAVEALAQRAAPHVHERHRQGQRPRLRHHARRRGPALGAALPRASRCGTSSTPASSSTASRPTTSSSARTSPPRSAARTPSSGRAAKETLKKIRNQMTKDYVIHPLLSGPSFLNTLAANATANLVRNLWTHSVIMCGHFPEGVETFERRSIEGETRGEWYLRQMLGSANISGSKAMHFMTGNLSLPDRAPPLPRPAEQPLPGDRAAGAGPVPTGTA